MRSYLNLTLFFLLISYIFIPVSAQSKYAVSLIPEDLKKNANAVVRDKYFKVEILAQDKMVYTNTEVITILNKNAENQQFLNLYFDKDESINSAEILIYDAAGNQIKKISKNDFSESSVTDGFSLYTGSRMLSYSHVPVNYPYSIAYRYSIQTANTAFIPSVSPIEDYGISVERSMYELVYPGDIGIRIKESGLEHIALDKKNEQSHISYTFNNLNAIQAESLSPHFRDIAPMVRFAPDKFHLAGVNGQADNWKDFGKWIYDNLLAGLDRLSKETILKIQSLVRDIEDPVERARLVYKYMQDKTRYISVQIGIGGWKPMAASEVDRLGYGDCKALTNYTSSLLKAAGVPSYYTIIYANEKRNIDPDLASIQGNHAILMVPNSKDTIWLECTDQKVPFGHIGKFTDDRDALVISPEGGKIIHTKTYSETDNLQKITGQYAIDTNGDLSGSMEIQTSGVQLDDHYRISEMNPKESEIYYKEYFDQINNIKLERLSNQMENQSIAFTETVELKATHYGVRAGEKMLLRVNAYNLLKRVPKKVPDRKLPFIVRYGFTDLDAVTVQIPPGYVIEVMPEPILLESRFGSYQAIIEKKSDHQLVYHRKFQLKYGKYEANDYEDFRKYLTKINQADNSKVIISKI